MHAVNLSLSEPVWSRNPNVIGAWSFGSSRDGHITPGSDPDFGVLFAREPSLTELATLGADLQRALGFEDIDVVVLNDAKTAPTCCPHLTRHGPSAPLDLYHADLSGRLFH